MNIRTVTEYRQFCAGQKVTVTPDSGFQAGIPSNHELHSIVVTNWTAEEARRLRVPREEFVLIFKDGKTAGQYDRIRIKTNYGSLFVKGKDR